MSSVACHRFRSVWRLAASADRVYAALADVESYPSWWPQVRSGRRIDETAGEARCRSLLPYDLVFVARRTAGDPGARVLAAQLAGDLTGTSRWTVSAQGTGSVAVFDEDVAVSKPSCC